MLFSSMCFVQQQAPTHEGEARDDELWFTLRISSTPTAVPGIDLLRPIATDSRFVRETSAPLYA